MGESIAELTKQNHHEESISRKAMEGNDHWESLSAVMTSITRIPLKSKVILPRIENGEGSAMVEIGGK